MQFFGQSNKEDIHAVGLVFEPNFFQLFYYADREAKNLIASEKLAQGAESEYSGLPNLYPLYALTFNAHYTLMPNDLFDENHAQEILAFTTESNSPNVDWNSDPNLKAKIIFERDIHSEQYLDRLFPGLQLKHGVHALLAYCRKFKSSEEFSVLVQNDEKFTLVVYSGDELKFVNTIVAKHKEDVIYFLLYTLKTLQVKTEQPLYLLGSAASDEHLLTSLKKYLSQVQVKPPISTNLPLDGSEVAKNWIGVHAYLCAL